MDENIENNSCESVNKCTNWHGSLFVIYILYSTQGGHNFRKLVILGIRSEENAFARGPEPRFERILNILIPTHLLVTHSSNLLIERIACIYCCNKCDIIFIHYLLTSISGDIEFITIT